VGISFSDNSRSCDTYAMLTEPLMFCEVISCNHFSCVCGTSKWPVVVCTGSALSVSVEIPVFFDG